jgi:hypothetical protein
LTAHALDSQGMRKALDTCHQPKLDHDLQESDGEGEGEGEAPAAHAVESQGERVRRSLVMLDVNLPSIALPDGVHCRSFTGMGSVAVRLSKCPFGVVRRSPEEEDWPSIDDVIACYSRACQVGGTSKRMCADADEHWECHIAGNGVIVHQSETLGLVVTDRNTVPVSVGDVMLSFGAHPAEVEAEIRFLHPLHNFAILSYNPADLPAEVGQPATAAPFWHSSCAVKRER